jgi:tetratricopeptide (TPR) repeat protein
VPELSPNEPTRDAAGVAESRHQLPTEPATNPNGGPAPAAPPGYELREEIGRGGMGVVYRARDLALAREVAVKLLRDGYPSDSDTAQRFVEEAQITAQLQHPGIPAIHQTGTTADGRPFLAMKLVKGRTLADLLADRADPAADRGRFLAIFEHVCHAVGYAHAHRVLHRDLKPGNIMVGAFDEVQVMDWGLAKVVRDGPTAPPPVTDRSAEQTRTEIGPRRSADLETQAGSLLGTPAFMSPEQAGGETDKIGPRADVFGLGAILCVILTGQPPYRGPGVEAVRVQAIRGDLGDARARLDGCGAEPELVALAKRCLGELAERPADAAEVADAVARLRAAADERARRAELERAAAEVRVGEQRKRRRVWYGLATALLLGAAASVVLAVRARQAEGRALQERDLKEAARGEAVANEDKARNSEAARRVELGRTAAAAAELAAGHGQWKEALRLYETALQLGPEDDVPLKLGRYTCHMALGQVRPALAELDALARRPDLGRHAGAVRLCQAECALWRSGAGNPPDLARQAIALGLPPADEAYARVFLVRSAPEAIRQLQEATRRDPFHSRGLDWLAMLLFLTGRRDEFRETVTQLRLSRPGSAAYLACEVFLRAMDGDRAGAERVLTGLAQTDYAELMPMLRAFVEALVLAQQDEFFFGGLPAPQLQRFLPEYAAMAQKLSRVAGDKDPSDARLGNLSLFQLPMFRALADMPQIKGLTTAGLLGILALLQQPGTIADIFGAVARDIPDGSFFLLQGMLLDQAGRLPEAEAALRQALDHPSWARHRTAARYHLAHVHWELAYRPRTTPADQARWREKARADVRDLALSAGRPLPPQPTVRLARVALDCGEPVIGLALTEAALRQKPDDITLLGSKLDLQLSLGALDWAEPTAQAVGAALEAGAAQRGAGFHALLNLAEAYHNAARNPDALRWCGRVRQQLTRAGDGPDLEPVWNRLGVVYWRMNQLDQSIPIFERVWAALRKSRGPRDPGTLFAQANLAVNYRDAGQLPKAIPLLEQVARDGRGQPSLRWVRGELLTAYVTAKKSAEGVALVNEMLTEARREYPPKSETLAGALAQLGYSLVQLEAWKEAEPILREALRIREKVQPEAWNTFNARSLLGEALARQKQYAEAEPLLVQGFAGMKQRAAQIPPAFRALRLGEAADRLVHLNQALGRNDEAAKWRKEAEAVKKPSSVRKE